MTFSVLAVVGVAGLLGPLLALAPRARIPVVVGELAAGIIVGPLLLGVVDPGQPTLMFLAQTGFALVMFAVGSHVPVLDARLRAGLGIAAARCAAVGVAAVPLAYGIGRAFGTGHTALYAVLLASSSAALILPIVQGAHLEGRAVLELLPQVAIADAACIVALPLAIDPSHAWRAVWGALAVIGAVAVFFVGLRFAERRGWRKRLHDVSEERRFALELRINLVVLFSLAALAKAGGVSLLLAGFGFGLAVAGIGEPRRLAKQVFAVTEGFFGPLFFVWLGASLDLGALGRQPSLIGLGIALGLGAVLAHLVTIGLRQPSAFAALAAAQLGVPVAAATLGTTSHVLSAGEPAALILGALVTIAVSTAIGPALR